MDHDTLPVLPRRIAQEVLAAIKEDNPKALANILDVRRSDGSKTFKIGKTRHSPNSSLDNLIRMDIDGRRFSPALECCVEFKADKCLALLLADPGQRKAATHARPHAPGGEPQASALTLAIKHRRFDILPELVACAQEHGILDAKDSTLELAFNTGSISTIVALAGFAPFAAEPVLYLAIQGRIPSTVATLIARATDDDLAKHGSHLIWHCAHQRENYLTFGPEGISYPDPKLNLSLRCAQAVLDEIDQRGLAEAAFSRPDAPEIHVLIRACRLNRPDIAQELLDRGIVPTRGRMPLESCLEDQDTFMVQHWLGSKVFESLLDMENPETSLSLHHAASIGNAKLCKRLIDHGFDAKKHNHQNGRGHTPLMLAVHREDPNGEIIRLLHPLSEPGSTNRAGRPLLHQLSSTPHFSKLHAANLTLLLELGEDPKLLDAQGLSALDIAIAEHAHDQPWQCLRRDMAIKLLTQAGSPRMSAPNKTASATTAEASPAEEPPALSQPNSGAPTQTLPPEALSCFSEIAAKARLRIKEAMGKVEQGRERPPLRSSRLA